MDLSECRRRLLVKDVRKDKNLIISLIKSSSKRLQSQALLKLDDTTAVSKVSLIYEGMREMLEAIGISYGYKIYNHECFCAFLKEILGESDLGDRFDKFRRVRNALNYYGKDISLNEAERIIFDMLKFIEEIKRFLEQS